MIKKFIITGALCLIASSINAQKKALSLNLQSKEDTTVSPIVKEKVEEYAAKINAIIQEEKKQMEKKRSRHEKIKIQIVRKNIKVPKQRDELGSLDL